MQAKCIFFQDWMLTKIPSQINSQENSIPECEMTAKGLPSGGEIHRGLANTKLRLIQEYGWKPDFVDAAVNEYIRFLEMHIAFPNITIVPGKVVDKVWHDHILHTRDYIAFCQSAFGDYMHHDPKDRSSDKVMDMKPTLELYHQRYGHPAPQVYWLDDVKVNLPHYSQVQQNVSDKPREEKPAYSGGCCRCH